jgi:bifunctional non-homologous end joining protein LigD
MLARLGEPFDSPDYLFEIKWDGIRALTFTSRGAYRLLSRNNRPLEKRFGEMSFLGDLNGGLIVDGEIVALEEGKPQFHLLLSKDERTTKAVYVVFDLLYEGFEPLMELPLVERRERLRAIVRRFGHPRLLFSDSVREHGRQFFESACSNGLEGVVAKRLNSRYLPGRRSDAWIKIKRTRRIYCAVIGFIPKGEGDFQSLVLASDDEKGQLSFIGTVGTGFTEAMRRRINAFLRANPLPAPVVPCELPACWVEPRLICAVEFSEITPKGLLRAPVFKELKPT